MPKKDSLNLREKSDYVTQCINDKSVNDLCYSYLYDITKYLVSRKVRGQRISNACYEDDIIQNIVCNIHNIVIIEGRYERVDSIFAFINQAVKLEVLKSYRKKYIGKADFIEDLSETELNHAFYGEVYFGQDNLNEVELLINLERSLFNIIKLIHSKLNQSNIQSKTKNLLVFPILLSYVREDNKLLNQYPDKVKVVAKEILSSLDSIRKFI